MTSSLLIGVNLAGAEFAATKVPGTYGVDYTYPTTAEIDYYASKGMDVIRLPFLWERLQLSENGPLDPTQLALLDSVVNYATSRGLKVDLDPHNYGYGFGNLIGSAQTPNSAFADFWGKLAAHYASNPNVMFGLMNEPHDQSASTWLVSFNAAISAIRNAGANQEILVPGSYYDGAWKWTTTDNAAVIGTGVVDPDHNFAFEVHQYLDADCSGTHSGVVSTTIGVERLTAITQWAEATGNRLFLGEVGVSTDQTSLTALGLMVTYMKQHTDAWQGLTYWAGGPWWGPYMFSIEPDNGVDKPQMQVLVSELGATPCYCAGTLIATSGGEVPVEDLAIGNEVLTLDGAARRVRWIGKRSYSGPFARNRNVQPVCIKAGALQDNVPRRDLWVSPHHAMFLEGVLIEAIDLTNDVSIIQAERVARVDYFHIELDTHDVIIAEGAPSESFVDDDSRAMFHNAPEFTMLYPDTPATPARYCAPRRAFGPEIERARKHVAERAGISYLSPTLRTRPQALVVDSVVPEHGSNGGANAILDHMRALQAAGFEVSFLATQEARTNAHALAAMGISLLRHAPKLTPAESLRRHAGRFDLVYLHRIENARRYGKLVRQYFDAQLVYGVADLHHVRLRGQSKLERCSMRAQELLDEACVVAIWELSAALTADTVITHSVTEAQLLQSVPTIAVSGKLHVVPWSVPVAPVRRSFADRSGIAFLGRFAHAPNLDAVHWLVDEVMPLLRRAAPEIECFIVGRDLPRTVRRKLEISGVTVMGGLDNLADAFERVRLTVAPLRFGAGLKDKVLRSLAAGLPCVGTPEAFTGMPDLPRSIANHCIGETASDIAAAIVSMHRDAALNARCAHSGLNYITANYGVRHINGLMQTLAQPALDRHAALKTQSGSSRNVIRLHGEPPLCGQMGAYASAVRLL